MLCDYLDRHNCNEQLALQRGDAFIEQHKSMLTGFVIKRWKVFIDERSIKFNEKLENIKSSSKPESPFMNKMVRTHKKCLTAQPVENSVRYQQEEYAAILCMDEFDELIYPKPISDGMAYLYGHFEGKKPNYNHIKVTQVKNTLFFESKKTSMNHNHMHVALRAELRHIEDLLNSDEIPLASKQLFADAIENILEAKVRSSTVGNGTLSKTESMTVQYVKS